MYLKLLYLVIIIPKSIHSPLLATFYKPYQQNTTSIYAWSILLPRFYVTWVINVPCALQIYGVLLSYQTVLEDIGGYGAWQRRWCVLDSAVLSYWRYPGDESIKVRLTLALSSWCLQCCSHC